MANGVIETSSGDLLRAGYATFVAGAGESLRADVPEPWKAKGQFGETQMHQWNGVMWVLVDQKGIENLNRARFQQGLNVVFTVDEDEQVFEWTFAKELGDTHLLIRSSISLGSFGIRIDSDASDRESIDTSATDVVVDIKDLANGNRTLKVFGRSAANTLSFFEVHAIKNL